MCVLESFIHDPLIEWSKKSKAPNDSLGLSSMKRVNQKLEGVIDSAIPLTIEGQVNQLILDATSQVNLCQMYIGWAAYY